MALASDVLGYVAEVYPDFDPASTMALRLLQEVHNQLLRLIRLYATETVDLTLVADQQEYTLPDTVLRIWQATYYYSAGSYVPLTETSYDKLDYESRTWRDFSSGNPVQYYDLGTIVGLYPKPATATSGGYPKVTLYVSKVKTLTTGTTMPGMAPDYDAWIAGVCEKWAMRNDHVGYDKWRAAAQGKRESLASFIMGRQARSKPNADFAKPIPRTL